MRRVRLLLLGAGLAVASIGRAQTPVAASAPAPLTAPAAGFRAEYVAEVDTVGTKLVQLAEAMPADKYGWRPGPGVRSVGEVYMHVVAGSSMLPTFLGASPMEGITRESEKTVTDKAKIDRKSVV